MTTTILHLWAQRLVHGRCIEREEQLMRQYNEAIEELSTRLGDNGAVVLVDNVSLANAVAMQRMRALSRRYPPL